MVPIRGNSWIMVVECGVAQDSSELVRMLDIPDDTNDGGDIMDA